MAVKTSKDVGGTKFLSKKWDSKKENQVCSHYNANGHTKGTCFKLNGYPNQWNECKGKKTKEKVNVVTLMAKTPLDTGNETIQSGENLNMGLYKVTQQEIKRFIRNHTATSMSNETASCVSFTYFAGKS